jgi:hypothetical protein
MSTSREATSCAATPELSSTLWNSKVQYRIHKMPLFWPRAIQSRPPHSIAPRSILTLSTQQRIGLPSALFPCGFPTNSLHAFRFSAIRATCPAHRILLNLTILIILGEEHKSRSLFLCSFLHPPITSSVFCPNILLITMLSNNLSLYSSLHVRDQISHNRIKLFYIKIYFELFMHIKKLFLHLCFKFDVL